MNKKISYSKILPVITGSIFVFVIVFSLLTPYMTYDLGTVCVTAITASAGCFTGTCVWYMKKAQAENAYKLQMAVYKEQARLELENLEKRFEIKQKFGVSKDDIDMQRMDSQLDDMTLDSFESVKSTVNMAADEANSSIDVSQFG